MSAFKPPGQCPACGEWVPRKAVACDCCGACERSGWQADSHLYDGLDLPEDDFDYDAFIDAEFGGKRHRPGINPLWWWVAVALLAAFGLSYLLPMWR